jgi:hypothetical protein
MRRTSAGVDTRSRTGRTLHHLPTGGVPVVDIVRTKKACSQETDAGDLARQDPGARSELVETDDGPRAERLSCGAGLTCEFFSTPRSQPRLRDRRSKIWTSASCHSRRNMLCICSICRFIMAIPGIVKSSPQALVEKIPVATPDEKFSLHRGLKLIWWSASPLQSHRACHRVFHLAAASFGVQMRGLELEVPLGRAIGVVDQHQVWVVF